MANFTVDKQFGTGPATINVKPTSANTSSEERKGAIKIKIGSKQLGVSLTQKGQVYGWENFPQGVWLLHQDNIMVRWDEWNYPQWEAVAIGVNNGSTSYLTALPMSIGAGNNSFKSSYITQLLKGQDLGLTLYPTESEARRDIHTAHAAMGKLHQISADEYGSCISIIERLNIGAGEGYPAFSWNLPTLGDMLELYKNFSDILDAYVKAGRLALSGNFLTCTMKDFNTCWAVDGFSGNVVEVPLDQSDSYMPIVDLTD